MLKILNIFNPFFWEQSWVYFRASNLIEKNKFVEAKEYIKKFLTRKHYVTEGHYYLLGIAYLNLKDFQTAEECLITSLKYNFIESVFQANTYFYLGLTYYEWEKYQIAIENFKKAMEIKKRLRVARDIVISLAHVYCYLGRAYAKSGNRDEAFKTFNAGLKYDSNNSALHRELTILGI